jgi:hypothetical protein
MACRIERMTVAGAARVFCERGPSADSLYRSHSYCRVVHWSSSREWIRLVEWNTMVGWSLAKRRLTRGCPLNLIQPNGRIYFLVCPTVLVNRRGPGVQLVDLWVVSRVIP